MLEHDKYFWKTVTEIRRVTRRGGVIVIGVPGYTEFSIEKPLRRFAAKLPLASRLGWLSHLLYPDLSPP
jgi:hypothetical protein